MEGASNRLTPCRTVRDPAQRAQPKRSHVCCVRANREHIATTLVVKQTFLVSRVCLCSPPVCNLILWAVRRRSWPMYIYIIQNMHKCIYTYLYVFIAPRSTYIYIYIYIFIIIAPCRDWIACPQRKRRVYACVILNKYIYIYIYMYICIFIYTYIYINFHRCSHRAMLE